jgi:hypothetical protein
MKFSINRFMQGSLVIALVLCASACNSTDSSDKAKDSVGMASAAMQLTDSTATVKAKKKKKGLTSVSGIMADSAKMVKDVHGVYNRADIMPEFPGGQTALANYINKNLAYPQSAVDNGTNGTLRVSFIVDEHGKVLNPQVANGTQLGDGLTDETLTVFNHMPLWTPGMVHGKKVKTRMLLPVTFELADADQ